MAPSPKSLLVLSTLTLLVLALCPPAPAHCPKVCAKSGGLMNTTYTASSSLKGTGEQQASACSILCLKSGFKYYTSVNATGVCTCADACAHESYSHAINGTSGITYTCFPLSPKNGTAACSSSVYGSCPKACKHQSSCKSIVTRRRMKQFKCCCNAQFMQPLVYWGRFYGCANATNP